MALFHHHGHPVDAVLTAVSWRRETIIQHSHMEWVSGGPRDPGHYQKVWTDGRVVASSGEGQENLHWEEFSLWPHERVHKQNETYTALFREIGDAMPESGLEVSAHLHLDVWQSLQVGATYSLEFNLLGHVHAVHLVAGA
jgi:hypothetical protein